MELEHGGAVGFADLSFGGGGGEGEDGVGGEGGVASFVEEGGHDGCRILCCVVYGVLCVFSGE